MGVNINDPAGGCLTILLFYFMELHLTKSLTKKVVGEDLGYILLDESRINEAIEAFLISEKNVSCSEYFYLELSQLYAQVGHVDKN